MPYERGTKIAPLRLSIKWQMPLDRGLHIALAQKRNFRRGRRAGSHLPATAQGLVQRAVQSEATASRAGRRAASAPCKESLAAQGFSLAPHRSLLAIKSRGLRPLTIPERLFRHAGAGLRPPALYHAPFLAVKETRLTAASGRTAAERLPRTPFRIRAARFLRCAPQPSPRHWR